MNNQITGKLIHIETSIGLANLDIRAWDKDSKHNDFIGQARTNEFGEFNISATGSYADHKHDQLPDLFFEVLAENGDVIFTESRARDNWNWDEGPIVLAIPYALNEDITVPIDIIDPELEPIDSEFTPFLTEENRFAISSLSEVAMLSPDQNDFLLNELENYGTIDTSFWENIDSTGVIEASQITEMKTLFDFMNLGNGDVHFAQSLKNTGINNLTDLVSFDTENWESFIEQHQIAVPDEFSTISIYALFLEDQITEKFPQQVFQLKLNSTADLNLLSTFEQMNNFIKKSPEIMRMADSVLSNQTIEIGEEINWGTDSEKQITENALANYHTISNLYYEMGVHEIFLNTEKSAEDKLVAFQEEVQKLATFSDQNPELELADFNFISDIEQLKWTGIKKADQPKIVKQFMALQRIYRITPNYKNVKLLLSNGLNSAAAISAIPLSDFEDLFSGQGNLAKVIYDRAQSQAATSMMSYINLKETVGSTFYNTINVGQNMTAFKTNYDTTPGFNEILHGSHYCGCSHCQSLYGPAAYLTDLLRFTEQNISAKNKIKPLQQLFARRPDLLALELNCENTHATKPFTEIINDILTARLMVNQNPTSEVTTIQNPFLSATSLFAGSITSTQPDTAVLIAPDKKLAFYEKVAKHPTPQMLPHNYWVNQIQTYLEELGVSGLEIMHVLRSDSYAIAKETIGLTQEQANILTASNGSVKKMYGLTLAQILAHKNQEKESDQVGALLQTLGINFDQLKDLIRQDLSETEQSKKLEKELFINATGESKYLQLINKTTLLGLTNKRLNRIYRFVRLAEKLDWEYAELDQVLRALGKNKNGEIDQEVLEHVALIKRIKAETGRTVIEIAGIWGYLDEYRETQNLFHETFNSKFISDGLPKWQLDKTVKVNLKTETNPTVLRLAAAFDLRPLDIYSILQFIEPIKNTIKLDRLTFGKVYSLCKTASIHAISGSELCQILKIEKVSAFKNLNGWVSFSNRINCIKPKLSNLEQVHFILTGNLGNHKLDWQPSVVKTTQKAFIKESETIKKELEKKFAKEGEIKTQMIAEQIPLALAKFAEILGLTTESVKVIFRYTNQKEADLVPLFDQKSDSSLPKGLSEALNQTSTYIELLKFIGWSPTFFQQVIATNNAIYNAQFSQLTLEKICDLSALRAAITKEEDFIDLLGLKNAALVTSLSKRLSISKTDLTAYTNYRQIQTENLLKPIVFLDLYSFARYIRKIDCSGQHLVDLTEIQNKPRLITPYNRYGRLKAIAEDWRSILKTSSKNNWAALNKKMHTKFSEESRIVLVNQGLWNLKIAGVADFKTTTDLYDYLLIDVEMGACAEISPIKEAILAVQLYIQRCQTNLEADIAPATINEQQWEWMKNYRVWEANRKIFLYPENYIEPELRIDKTNLFKQLEDEILQSELTSENANKAIRNYTSDLAELSSLTTAGACFDDSSNTLYQIGKTAANPARFYHRTYQKTQGWSVWFKLEIPIQAAYVNPVFAFGRLFIFWIDIIELENTHKNDVDWHQSGSVKCAYLKNNGQWTTPNEIWKSEDLYDTKNAKTLYGDSNNTRIYIKAKRDYIKARPVYFNQIFPTFSGNQIHLIFGYKKVNTRLSIAYQFTLDETLAPIPSYDNSETHLPSAILSPIINERSISRYNLRPVRTYSSEQTYFHDLFDAMHFPKDYVHNGKSILKLIASDKKVKITPVIQHHKTTQYFCEADGNQFLVKISDYSDKFEIIRSNSSATYKIDQLSLLSDNAKFLSTEAQNTPELHAKIYNKQLIIGDFPSSSIDLNGAFRKYYQELFFHIPFLIANQFNGNQKFKESQKWYHYIFNPIKSRKRNTTTWNYRPLTQLTPQSIQDLVNDSELIAAYKEHPFQPHILAQLRPSVYQRSILMKYIDNLIDWADQLFARDTWETTNEAVMLYLLAGQILGPKPEKRGQCAESKGLTFKKLRNRLGAENIPDFLSQLENKDFYSSSFVSGFDLSPWTESDSDSNPDNYGAFSNANLNVFCIPENKDFIAYWDRIADRMFKIRHCINIKGVKRQLALFQPAIDPRSIVSSVANGENFGDFMNQLDAPTSHFRFGYLLDRARNFTGQIQQLGSMLLSAAEKKDNEEIQILNATHYASILKLTTDLKKTQIDESLENLDAIGHSIDGAQLRLDHYSDLIENGYSGFEIASIGLSTGAAVLSAISALMKLTGGTVSLAPTVTLGFPPSVSWGGRHIGDSFTNFADSMQIGSNLAHSASSIVSTVGSLERRAEEWKFQKKTIEKNLLQLKSQLAGAKWRLSMAEKELEIHQNTIANQKEQLDFIRNKFSSLELHQWMKNQLSTLYFQSYKLAYNLSKKAENAFRLEQNSSSNSTYINFGHWNSRKIGLLAGERLQLELNQLENAYLQEDTRELEIEKIIPLSQLPVDNGLLTALLSLIQTGRCEFKLTEKLFDLDYPGHCARKIRSISISIPAIIGPYETIKATLTQTKHSIRQTDDIKTTSDKLPENSVLKNQQVALSSGVGDTGMFELNFRGERYLAFEQTGAISEWVLEMPHASNNFDFKSITDVIIKVQYTAVPNELRRKGVVADLNPEKVPGINIHSLKQENATEWFNFMNPAEADTHQIIKIAVEPSHFPQNLLNLSINQLSLVIDPLHKFEAKAIKISGGLTGNKTLEVPMSISGVASISIVKAHQEKLGELTILIDRKKLPKDLRKKVGNSYQLDESKLSDIALMIEYSGNRKPFPT